MAKTTFDVGDRVLVRGRGTGFLTTAPTTFSHFATVELDSGLSYGAYLRELVQLEPIMPDPDLEALRKARFEFEKEFFETSMSGTFPKGRCLIIYGPPKTGKYLNMVLPDLHFGDVYGET